MLIKAAGSGLMSRCGIEGGKWQNRKTGCMEVPGGGWGEGDRNLQVSVRFLVGAGGTTLSGRHTGVQMYKKIRCNKATRP